MVKAHIGSKIFTRLLCRTDRKTFSQPLTQIQSLRVTGESALLDLQVTLQNLMTQEIRQRVVNRSKKLKRRYLSQVRLDMDGTGHESSEKTMCHGTIYT